jgi:NAD+ synthase
MVEIMRFHKNILEINPKVEINRMVEFLHQEVRGVMRRYGAVVGISGGIDSSTVLALCVEAFGPERVTALMMPDKDSDRESEPLARNLAKHFGVDPILEDITPALEGFNCYYRRDESIKRVYPSYDPEAGYKSKIVLPQNLLEKDTLNVFYLTVVKPDGTEETQRLPVREYMQIVAASNLKQRTRMSTLYYHAERQNFAVIGTANKNEHAQGFFVKYGDGGVDIQLIAHLYKTQVYQIAAYLGVPEEIQKRPPTTDTYSAHCTQEEFFFRLPFQTMDLLWYAQENNYPLDEVAEAMDLTKVQVQRAFDDFTRKKRTTDYLRSVPTMVVDR